MKKYSAVCLIALAACTLLACHGRPTATGIVDTAQDSAVVQEDTLTSIHLAVDKEDTEFAFAAANTGQAEVEMGKLAIQKGKNKKVKNFGVMMVKEHGRANTALLALLKAKGLTLPVIPDTAAQKTYASLSKRSGADFDKAYIGLMMVDHASDVKMFEGGTMKIQDPDLKAFAQKTLPVLKKHLDAINAIHDSMH